METKKWSTKKKVLVSILVILCAAIIAGVLYMFFKPEPLPQVSTAKVTKGSITQTLDMSGKVSSSQKGNFVPIDGTKVLTVNVKVGEYVKRVMCLQRLTHRRSTPSLRRSSRRI